MHTYYSKTHQPYHYGEYSIFVAEVASLFNESLLRHMLLSRCQNKLERLEILNRALEDMSRTLFRQTQFAEFELFAHTAVEQNTTLTPKLLNDKYLELSRAYSGPAVSVDPAFGITWSMIPHFYTNFYVYQYATGISAALALSEQVLQGDTAACERYLDFLKAGSSSYPLDVLAKAGCDMRSPEPIHKALDVFEAYLTEFEQLVKPLQDHP
jgi:oligoendopeptidase F